MVAAAPSSRTVLSLVAGAAALAAAAMLAGVGTAEAQNAKAGDAEKLQGKWRGWVVFGKGENPNQGPLQLELTVKGDRISSKHLGGMGGQNPDLGEGTFRLFKAGKFGAIDAVGVSGQSKNKTFLGIYSVEADTWKWCTANFNQKARPDDFATRKANYYMILKRER
jgi:uncharacterized protein (TIGR03067 family)